MSLDSVDENQRFLFKSSRTLSVYVILLSGEPGGLEVWPEIDLLAVKRESLALILVSISPVYFI